MDPVTAMYVSQGIHGLAYGMVLFLVASGLTLIFGMMGILNLAHASFFMLSAYFSYTVLQLTGNFWLALLIAPVAAAVLGILVERFLLRKIHAFGHIGELILTVGVSLPGGQAPSPESGSVMCPSCEQLKHSTHIPRPRRDRPSSSAASTRGARLIAPSGTCQGSAWHSTAGTPAGAPRKTPKPPFTRGSTTPQRPGRPGRSLKASPAAESLRD